MRKNYLLVFLFVLPFAGISQKEKSLKEIIDAYAKSFLNKIDSSYNEIISFGLTGGTEKYTLRIEKDKMYRITEGLDTAAAFSFVSTLHDFNKIHRGEMNALTAMAQAKANEPIPLQYTFSKTVKPTPELINRFFFVVQRFFNAHPNDRLVLKEEYSRLVHGGHAIPIFYQKNQNIGVRSAWYQLNKGEKANEVGVTDPFPQYMIIINGSGKAKLGNDIIEVKKGEAYYIAPGTDHVIWNEKNEPLQAIWIAWGKGA